jgi:GDPmannose 4,6-dehydratase
LITGITGQDGSYLAELLLGKGYEVHGVSRSRGGGENLSAIRSRLFLHQGDLTDAGSLLAAVRASEPDEVYTLGAVSHVPASWGATTSSADCTALGVARILDALIESGVEARFFQASSSEMFPHSGGSPQDESTPIHPRSPYGAAKAYGHFLVDFYRRRHGLFACSGILFNHESPRRGREFVTRRVSRGAASIKRGLASELGIGNLEARRDWGYAPEYVEAMWLMLQQEEPDDFVIGSGSAHSVAELVETAFAEVGLDPDPHLRSDDAARRPADDAYALADPSKARERLGWSARTGFSELVRAMVAADLSELDDVTSTDVQSPPSSVDTA